ncbi:unnamed protein product, partial [Mesorhabditis spiculigera]
MGILKIVELKMVAHGDHVLDLKEYPFMASLHRKDPTTGKFKAQCGATILNQQWVLTAGHCVWKHIPYKNTLKIQAGTINSDPTKSGQMIDVTKVIMHEGFVNKSGKTPRGSDFWFYNDIAVLKLKSKLTYGGQVGPAILVNNAKEKLWPAGQKATIMGWGYTNMFPVMMPSLLSAPMTAMSEKECTRQFPTDYMQLMICASGFLRGPCPGDSGGPIVREYFSKKSGKFKNIQVGIISRGPGNCQYDNDEYAAFTDTYRFCGWIERIIGLDGICKRLEEI